MEFKYFGLRSESLQNRELESHDHKATGTAETLHGTSKPRAGQEAPLPGKSELIFGARSCGAAAVRSRAQVSRLRSAQQRSTRRRGRARAARGRRCGEEPLTVGSAVGAAAHGRLPSGESPPSARCPRVPRAAAEWGELGLSPAGATSGRESSARGSGGRAGGFGGVCAAESGAALGVLTRHSASSAPCGGSAVKPGALPKRRGRAERHSRSPEVQPRADLPGC